MIDQKVDGIRNTVKSKYTRISYKIYHEKTSILKARTDLFRKPQEASSILESVYFNKSKKKVNASEQKAHVERLVRESEDLKVYHSTMKEEYFK